MIKKIELNKAFEGDYVKVNVSNNKKRIEGEIIEILKRNKKEFIGEFKEHKRFLIYNFLYQLPTPISPPFTDPQNI